MAQTFQTGQELFPAQKTPFLKASLLIERNEEGAWVLHDLPHWFTRGTIDVNLVQAMDSVSDGGWLQADATTFWETISQRHDEVLAQRAAYHRTLLQNGFYVSGQETVDLSEPSIDMLLDEFESNPRQLMIIGASQKLPKKGLTSRFVQHLVSQYPASVLLLRRPRVTDGPLRVLLAVDESEASLTAARKLPQLFPDRKLEVSVVTIYYPIYMENPVAAPYINTEAVDFAIKENARVLLEVVREILENGGATVIDAEPMMGTPSYELLVQAELKKPDLLVVGSHNKKDFPGWILGSVSSRMIQSAKPSVLVVR